MGGVEAVVAPRWIPPGELCVEMPQTRQPHLAFLAVKTWRRSPHGYLAGKGRKDTEAPLQTADRNLCCFVEVSGGYASNGLWPRPLVISLCFPANFGVAERSRKRRFRGVFRVFIAICGFLRRRGGDGSFVKFAADRLLSTDVFLGRSPLNFGGQSHTSYKSTLHFICSW